MVKHLVDSKGEYREMRRGDQNLIFSASDIVNFLGCPHRTVLDYRALTGEIEPDADDEFLELLAAKGIEHEEAYLQQLSDDGKDVCQISLGIDVDQQLSETASALRSGAEVIYQAAFINDEIFGRADFLVLTKTPSELGPFSYDIVDTKLARNPDPKFLIQLCSYAAGLEKIQGRPPDKLRLVLGDGRTESYATQEFSAYYRNALERFREFSVNLSRESLAEPCAACTRCHWFSHCQQGWDEKNHLKLVAGISRSQIAKLRAKNILNVRKLARISERKRVPGIQEKTLEKLRHQAEIQEREKSIGEPQVDVLPLDEDEVRGFFRLPKPHSADLFFDIEGDPLFPDGLEYLFGIFGKLARKLKYKPFWAHSHEEEKQAFEELVDFFAEHLTKYPEAHIYHYAHYEPVALKRLMSRYGTREHIVDELLRRHKFVDLYRIVRESIRVSRPSISLKDLEIFYMKEREAEVSKGGDSVVYYERWQQARDNSLLREIQNYNEEDCRSTALLRDWLVGLRPTQVPWFTLPTAEPVDPNLDDESGLSDRELRRLDYERRLLDDCPLQELDHHQLVAHLLDFHRREAKSSWWMLFERATATTEELIEDNECLGGLSRATDHEDEIVRRSVIRTYRFPPQETKLRPRQSCKLPLTLAPAGTIVDLDRTQNLVRIRRGMARGELPEQTSLLPEGPYNTDVITDAIFQYADGVIAGDKKYPAIDSLLKREKPTLKKHKEGSNLADASKDIVSETCRVVRSLANSHLFIQGPPGSGKTYTASHAIIDLIRAGKRVAITSNSHKAIINLLLAVEDRARDQNFPLKGQKKSNEKDPETHLGGEFIEDVFDNDSINPGCGLVAGTAWLLCLPDLNQVFDYLFVDEAGQISLANIVGMGTCARNIVLIGDHMQLAQPTQGIHPGNSGDSVLDHLLREHPTVPPDTGLFLPTSWRMHEGVCRFISDVVYEGRLEPELANENQRIVLGKKAHPILKPTGIVYCPVSHTGCSQESQEEAEVVAGLIRDLVGRDYIDRKRKRHRIKLEDILIVSPYNIQVNLLRSRLPEGARVGTVDKFQGQEAPVSIISMATSSAEDAPRGVDFLLSKNRLNVAISRAKCLAIFVASPVLTDLPCHTVDQLRLVNMLCRLREYAKE